MKKKILCAGLALSMAFSNISSLPTLAAIDSSWIVDWTGKDGNTDFNVTTTENNQPFYEGFFSIHIV